MYEDYLMHHGVKGMKWGVRKSKPPSKNRQKKKNIKISRRQIKKELAAAKERDRQAKAIAARRERILSSPSLLYKHRKEFSEKEIRDAINKINLDRQLKQLSQTEVSKGAEFINKGAKLVNNYVKVASTASKVLNTTKVLNASTGGLLFGFVDKHLKDNKMYADIKKEIDDILKDKKDEKDEKDKK